MIARILDRVTAALFGSDARGADLATGAHIGLGVGLLIGYIALREIGSLAPLFAWMVEWLMPVALFMGLLAQRRRTSLFGRAEGGGAEGEGEGEEVGEGEGGGGGGEGVGEGEMIERSV